jgi:hypothetical protein
MTEPLNITTERVDDIPLLLAQLDRMGVQPLLDEYFPTHGNWVGLSLGWVTVLWLTHSVSEANHRLNHVAPWAAPRLHTLRCCTGQPVHPLDLSDDRLGSWRSCVMTHRGTPLKGLSPSHGCACTTCSPSACGWTGPRPAGTGA